MRRPKKISQIQLLYVEDDAFLASAMIRWFESRRCNVTHVTIASAAVELLRGRVFDAVITDWELIGPDTGEIVVKEAQLLHVPVRIYSGSMCKAPWSEIWISKGFTDSLEDFLDGFRWQ